MLSPWRRDCPSSCGDRATTAPTGPRESRDNGPRHAAGGCWKRERLILRIG